ncbi:uncharacterized protein LOC131157007 [Malania oleifera]|uniref:uncharacterized protein LOC131157007 n=1 Tax=Malania oleifera TaxID=397392 RepID=UPI0025ADF11C|nr:uncharacterized protein LOC131157007 [Malania oleifera]
MGCSSSKRIEATVDFYRPPPASFAAFDISAVEEPWLKAADATHHLGHQDKSSHAPPAILDKLTAFEHVADAGGNPASWAEVSKALEDLKPTLRNNAPVAPPPVSLPAAMSPPPPPPPPQVSTAPKSHDKRLSFHTVEELDAKLERSNTAEKKLDRVKNESESRAPVPELKKLGSVKNESNRSESRAPFPPPAGTEGLKPVSENAFLVRDRLEKGGGVSRQVVRDPLSEFPEKCPPGGGDAVVVYTTSLGGVRRTREDCERVKAVLEGHGVVVDERDVAVHGGYRAELRAVLGEEAAVPRVFVKGRYLGGAEEVVGMNESGRLGKVLSRAQVERGAGRRACGGCGGLRFVPCLECGGSCKVVKKTGGGKVGIIEKERCSECNENGLVHCPVCI